MLHPQWLFPQTAPAQRARCSPSCSKSTWRASPPAVPRTWRQVLGCESISKSQISRICQELGVVVESFLGRPLDAGPYLYLWLDADPKGPRG